MWPGAGTGGQRSHGVQGQAGGQCDRGAGISRGPTLSWPWGVGVIAAWCCGV